jgi:predicted permease
MSGSEAARAARRQFGNVTLLQEDRRALRTFRGLEAWWQDLRYALRALARDPAFAAASIVTLGLGIGAATAIFSVIHNVMLAPFPYQGSDRMVFLQTYDPQQGPDSGRAGHAPSEVLAFSEAGEVFEGTTAALGEAMLYRHRTGTEALEGAHVTPGTFEFFGLPALHGRALQAADHQPGAPPVFVLRYKTWVERFGGDPGVLDQTFVLNGTPRTLVGIMPPRFGWYGADVFVPASLPGRGPNEFWFLVGRLRPGVSVEQARARLTVVAAQLAKAFPDLYPPRFDLRVVTLVDVVVGPIKPTLYTVLAAVGLLLVIACGNVANLLLVRATTREKELGLRAALGAGRARIARLLFVESLVLAAAAAALGILLAWGGLKALVALLPANVVPSEAVIELNAPVLTLALAVAVLTAIACGLAPALQWSRREPTNPLRDSGKGTDGGFQGRRLRDGLVVVGVALSLTLSIGAGLLMRSFAAQRDVRLGMQPDQIFTAVLRLPDEQYATAGQVTAFVRQVLARIEALPGVAYASASTAGALAGGAESGLEIAGRAPAGPAQTLYRQVTEDYVPALRLEVRDGRAFADADVTDARRVALVNEAFVRTHLGGDRPVGQRVRLAALEADAAARDAWFEVVGVVGDVRNRGLLAPVEPEVLIPATISRSLVQVLNVRTRHDPATLANDVRRAVSATDAAVPIIEPGRLQDIADRGLYAGPRFGFLVMTVFACIGLVLMSVGVYSVIAYSTARRTHEIGIRMALGARRADVLATIVGSGLRLVGVGVAMGLGVSLLLARALDAQLVDVTAHDPATFAGAAALLAAVAAAASWIPARRAARVDPLVALRR